MKRRPFALAGSVALVALLAGGAAWARNPHCAGGIQYLTQAITDKQKGNLDDYHREISKAVQQLEMCSTEDPNDLEAVGYLGWAYAEVDSMCAAGKAFGKAVEGLSKKGDKRKLDMVTVNRESYWASAFNQGIAAVTKAQQLFNPYTNEPTTDDERNAKAEAKKSYGEALADLDKALCLKPGDPRTLRNIGAVHGFMGENLEAERYFRQGLAAAPNDSDLTQALHSARTNRATQLLKDKKFDEAIQYYHELLKESPQDGDLWGGLADAGFAKAKTLEGDTRKAGFKSAADAYAKAGELKPEASELHFNAAVCYGQAGDLASAEQQWRAVLKLNPKDSDAMAELATVLAEEKKFPDAIAMAQGALALEPKKPERFQRLGIVYSKASDNARSKQALLAFLALRDGKTADAPTTAAGAAGAKVQGSMGKPEQIVLWEAEGQKYESWFYFGKGLAFHFGGGSQLEKTDWSAGLAGK